MKNLLFVLLLSPLLGLCQSSNDLIFEIATIEVSPAKAAEVENAMGAHNKKYHLSGASGVRVFNVTGGRNNGSYKWVMGPAPWSSLDSRPDDEAHNMDWEGKVATNLLNGGHVEYIRFDRALSRFPKDFNVNKLLVRYVDVSRGKMSVIKGILENVQKVYVQKFPEESYGVYYNELVSTSAGRDITIVYYFDKYAWMGEDNDFDAKYDEVHGKGSADTMWAMWRENTIAVEDELWEYNEKLSGMSPMVKAADRQ